MIIMTKKEMAQIRLQILKAEGPDGLKRFNDQYRAKGMPRGKQVHNNRTHAVAKGACRRPKHPNREYD